MEPSSSQRITKFESGFESSSQAKVRERTVWVLARPITAANNLGFLSEGKFPLCHWAILLSDMSALSFKVLWHSKHRTQSNNVWRILFELFRGEGDINMPHELQDFGANKELIGTWKTVAATLIGTSPWTDDEISVQGLRVS
jgi:hypothetical protein